MSNLKLLKETSSQICKDLFLEENKICAVDSFFELKILLTTRIKEMLSADLHVLMNLLYRIDVNEQKLKAAFNLNSQQSIAMEIAELIIERENQKIELRNKYK